MREIEDLTKKAGRFLRTAKLALNCVSRCYYAMFFMAEVVLLTKGLKASSHTQRRDKSIGKHFVKTGVFKKDLGKSFNDAYDKRQVGDYGVGFTITEKEGKDVLATAKNFVYEIKSTLKEG